MVPLDRALVRSYRLSIVTMPLTAAVWPQFATQVFWRGIGRLTRIGSYVNKQVTMFTFLAQATTCSKHHTRTVMDAGCECAPWVRSANPSDSWALVFHDLLRPPISDHSVGSVMTVHNHTAVKCDDWNASRVCSSHARPTQNTPSITVMK